MEARSFTNGSAQSSHCRCALLFKYQLVIAYTDRHDAAVIADVEEGFSGALLHLACEIGQLVDPVDMHVEVLVPAL